MEGDSRLAVCSKLNRHVQIKVAERGMSNSDEEAGPKNEVRHVGRSGE